jgi:hypothetical protein
MRKPGLPESQRGASVDELEDFFRSQFRAEEDAPRSPIEVLDWGLKHIDRLRGGAGGRVELIWKKYFTM